jgi:cytochrome c oxidase subunit 4
MTQEAMAQDAEMHEEQHGMTVRGYVIVGAILTAITAVELAVSYSDLGALLIPILLVLSAVKFAMVGAYFMHLRFDPPLLTQMFLVGLVLATAIMIALLALFWNDVTDAVANAGVMLF